MNTALWTCVVVVVVAVCCDVTHRRIPNLVTLGGLLAGVGIHGAVGFVDGSAMGALRGAGLSLLGAVACGLVPFLAWRRGELGGGDVKLFAAIGALAGPLIGFDVEARAFAFAFLVLFPFRLVRHGALHIAVRNMSGIRNVFRPRDRRVPYTKGPAIPPMILGPTIGGAFLLTMAERGFLP